MWSNETSMERLSHNEKGFVKDIVNGETGTQAALNNYDTTDENSAAVIASKELRKDKIQVAIKTIAEKIPDDLLVEKNIALLNKMETKEVRLPDGTTEVIESNQIDARAVAKGLDIAHRVKGNYAPEGAVNVNVNINPILVKFVNGTETTDNTNTE